MIIPLLVLHGFVTVSMIGIILLQKSDDSGPLGIGGGGGNNALFTARGVANILTRSTTILAVLFIGNCILINRLTNSDLRKAQNLFVEDVQQEENSKAKEEKAGKEKKKAEKKAEAEKKESSEKGDLKKEAIQENSETSEAKPETGILEDTQPSSDKAKAIETSRPPEMPAA